MYFKLFHRFLLLSLQFALPCSLACQNTISKDQLPYYLTENISRLENSLLYLRELLERTPEDKWHFRPSPEVMSYQEQVIHIFNNILYLSNYYFGYSTTEELIGNIYTKADLLTFLEELTRSLPFYLEDLTENKYIATYGFRDFHLSGNQILNLINDHISHHRGQLIVYLRLLEIQPPPYKGW